MHEYHLVEGFVQDILKQVEVKNITGITTLRFRRGSTISEPAMLQAFDMLTRGTLLEGVRIEVESFEVEHTCRKCGRSATVHADELVGHTYYCPECGEGEEIEEAHALEFLGLEIAS